MRPEGSEFGRTAQPERVRPERVAEAFKEILAAEIPRLKDPRVGFVTVTDVDVTPDLRRAHVFYTVLGAETDHRATRAALGSARGHLRRTLGSRLRLKYVPELEFEEDAGAARSDRVEEILRSLRAEGEGESDG